MVVTAFFVIEKKKRFALLWEKRSLNLKTTSAYKQIYLKLTSAYINICFDS